MKQQWGWRWGRRDVKQETAATPLLQSVHNACTQKVYEEQEPNRITITLIERFTPANEKLWTFRSEV